jgi:hypothetical protein
MEMYILNIFVAESTASVMLSSLLSLASAALGESFTHYLSQGLFD